MELFGLWGYLQGGGGLFMTHRGKKSQLRIPVIILYITYTKWMRIKKGQKDSEEEESIYEKEGKEGNNDMCGKFTITWKTKQRKKKSS